MILDFEVYLRRLLTSADSARSSKVSFRIQVFLIALLITMSTLLLYPPIALALTVGEIKNISNTSGSSGGPDLKVSDEGAILIAWGDDDPGQQDIFFAHSSNNGQDFDLPVNLSNDGTFSNPPKIATSGVHVYLVWSDLDFGEIFFLNGTMNDDGTVSFGTPVNLSNTLGFSTNPEIASSGSSVYVVWVDDDPGQQDIFFTNSTDGGETFSTPVNLSDNEGLSQSPKITISGSGSDVYVAWQDDSLNPFVEQAVFVETSTDSGLSFGELTTTNIPSGMASNPDIVTYGGDLYVVWGDGNPNYDIFFSRGTVNTLDSTTNFGSPVNVSNNTGFSFESQLEISGSGIIYVVWLDDIESTPSNEVYVSNSTDGGQSFSRPIRISSGANAILTPQLSILPSNQEDLFVLWRDDNVGNGDIFLSEITNSGLSVNSPINLSSNDDPSISPTISAFEDRIYVTWKDSFPGNDEIIFMVIETTDVTPVIAIQSPDINDSIKWGRGINASGTTNGGSSDSVIIDWGDGSSDPVAINGSTWGPVSHSYAASSTGTIQIAARLVDSGGNEKASSDPVAINVLSHMTSLSLDISPNIVLQGGNLTVEGTLTDLDDNTEIGGATIIFDGTGSLGIDSAITDVVGSYSSVGTSPNSADTLWTLQANFGGNSTYEQSSSQIKNFDTAPLNAIQFIVPIGSPSTIELTGFNASIMFDKVLSEETVYVYTCETPANPRYISLNLCYVVSATDDIDSDSFAYLTISYAGLPLPDGHTAEEIDLFHESATGFVDITQARNLENEMVTGRIDSFSKFVVGIAVHAPPQQQDSLRKQVFVGQNELVFNELQAHTISFDGSQYSVGSQVTVTIEDIIANKESALAESLEANITSSSDQLGIRITLIETEINSGIFKGTFTVDDSPSSDELNIIHVQSGDAIEASYLSPAKAPLKLIFDEISEAGIVEVNPYMVDQRAEINADDFDAISDAYEFHLVDAQVAPDTNITIEMSYVNVNLEDDEIISTDLFSILQFDPESIVSGKYSWIDRTKLDPVDGSRMINTSEKTVTGISSFTGNFTIGHDFRCCPPGGSSGGLPRPGTGILLDAIAGTAIITSGNAAHSGNGDHRTAIVMSDGVITDIFPESYFEGHPLARVQVTNPRLINEKGAEISQVTIGQPIDIASTLTNPQMTSQNFSFIVMIIDERGFATYISLQDGTIASGQHADRSISWIPDKYGTYTFKILVWDNLDKPSPLSSTLAGEIRVFQH